MAGRVMPYTEADLLPSRPRERKPHVGRIVSAPAEVRRGEWRYDVEFRNPATGKTYTVCGVRELVTGPAQNAAGRLGPGDAVQVQQVSRSLWEITGLVPVPDRWESEDPPAQFQSGDSELVLSPDGARIGAGEDAAHGLSATSGGAVRLDGDLVRIEGEAGTVIIGPGFRVGKQDPAGELPDDALLVYAGKLRLHAEEESGGSAMGLQLELSEDGLAVLDAAGSAPGAFHLALVDSAGWAGVSSGTVSRHGVEHGDLVTWSALRSLLKVIGAGRVSGSLVTSLSPGSAVGTVTPPARAVPPAPALAAPANRRAAFAGAAAFAWDAVAGAGEYLLRMAGHREQADPHPAVVEFRTAGASKSFAAGVLPPLGGAERTFWDPGRIAAATGITNRLVSSSAYASPSGTAASTTRRPTGPGDVAATVLAIIGEQQVRTLPAGAPRAAAPPDFYSVTALAWSVTALPDDPAANSPSAPAHEIMVYLQTRIGVVFA